jgi:hypothetical protein
VTLRAYGSLGGQCAALLALRWAALLARRFAARELRAHRRELPPLVLLYDLIAQLGPRDGDRKHEYDGPEEGDRHAVTDCAAC